MAKKKKTPFEEKPEVNRKEVKRIYTPKIKKYKSDLYNEEKRLVFAEGLPFTGKTLNAVEAGVEQVVNGLYDKLIIIRPVLVPECGLLPGTLEDKMALYTRQAREYVDDSNIDGWINLCFNNKIEVLPADQLQGNHFKNGFVIVDEAQNIPYSRTFKTLTRIGDNAKFVIIGDTSLGQENEKIKHNNLLQYSINKFAPYQHEAIGVHSFYDEEKDVLGDAFTKFIIHVLIPDFVERSVE